ncbi:hypothetical protein R1flu_017654 [Riccia fluitans]|uniref:Fe2OG dioxygenase domain-containing protein n=1 Tax=Riccia fluitans TaxID=41844 RepID=A0ABD1ZEW7_9MARC
MSSRDLEEQVALQGQGSYMYKGQNHYPLPVVDLKGRLEHNSDPDVRTALVQQLREAGKVGSFCVVNHGIEEKLLMEFKQVCRQFFALPLEEKINCSKTPIPGCYRPLGYQGQFHNRTQKSFVIQRREVFEIQGSPSSYNHDLVPWPELLLSFRGCLEAFAKEMQGLTKWMLEALAEGLGLGKDAFLKQIGGDEFHQQVNVCSYPMMEKQPKEIINPSTIAFGAHSDLTIMNLVLEDDVGGAQVYHDDRWFDVKPIPEGVTLFLGDPMECMSNGMYHAMIHRVVAPENNSRFSCVSTVEPIDKERTVIHPVPELVESLGTPAKYVPYNFLGRFMSIAGKRFEPEIMTKRFMVTDAAVLDSLRDFSVRDGVFHIGSRPLGSFTEGF